MKITMARSNSDMALLTEQAFCFCTDVLATANKMPIMEMSVVRDTYNRVFQVMKITMARSNCDTALLTEQAFCFCTDILARVNKIPIMTMSVASDFGDVNNGVLSSHEGHCSWN